MSPQVEKCELIACLMLALAETTVREELETYRWSDGVLCPDCGSSRPIYKQRRNGQNGYYRCPAAHRPRIDSTCEVTRFNANVDVRPDPDDLTDRECLNVLETDDEPDTEDISMIMASCRPYGPFGYYVLTGFEDTLGRPLPLVFTVRYNTMLMGSKVSLGTWLAFLYLLRMETKIIDLSRILGLTRKTATRMRATAFEHLKRFRRENLFILDYLDYLEEAAQKALDKSSTQ